jgi:hypothetical protein
MKGQSNAFPPLRHVVKRLKLTRQRGGDYTVTRRYLILFSIIAPAHSGYKKLQNSNCQGMSKAIQHSLRIANFTIDQQALLEINRKIATMGGGDSHCGKKRPLFVWCLSVFWGVLALRKK